MLRTLLPAAAAAFLLAAGGTAIAQQPSSDQKPAAQMPADQKPAEMQSHGTQQSGMKLDDLIGRDVVGEDGREIGELADIVLNPDTKQPNLAVVESGGFLGLGTKRIGIDYTLLEMNNDRVVAKTITQNQVEDMPTFEYSDNIVSLSRSGAATTK